MLDQDYAYLVKIGNWKVKMIVVGGFSETTLQRWLDRLYLVAQTTTRSNHDFVLEGADAIFQRVESGFSPQEIEGYLRFVEMTGVME